MNILRRLPLSRLLVACGMTVALGAAVAALALAVGTGPTPPPKPLAEAVHDALSAPKTVGVSARIRFTNHLIEGASLAGGGGEASGLASSPLVSGATGRLWIGSDGHARLELQSENGDTQILCDERSLSLYDASSNTLYRYTPPAKNASATGSAGPGSAAGERGKVPTLAEIEEGLARAGKHANVSGATPTSVAGQAAYTVRVSPREDGSLIGAAELSWDAVHGAPLRAAVYSTKSSTPAVELAATEISYGPVAASTLDFKPPGDAKVEEVTLPAKDAGGPSSAEKPRVSKHGKGLAAIALVESPVESGHGESLESQLGGLQKVSIDGTSASELPTELGTLLSFERAGVQYLLAGSVTPSAIEAFARGL